MSVWQPEAVFTYFINDCYGMAAVRAEMVTNVLIWIGAFDGRDAIDFAVVPGAKSGGMWVLKK